MNTSKDPEWQISHWDSTLNSLMECELSIKINHRTSNSQFLEWQSREEIGNHFKWDIIISCLPSTIIGNIFSPRLENPVYKSLQYNNAEVICHKVKTSNHLQLMANQIQP